MPHATVQVPAYKEHLTPTLDAIVAQDVPDHWSVSYEAWVTPTEPKDKCGTLQAARHHPTFQAFEAPEGFISTLNQMHDAAVDSQSDAIVKWDADAQPAHSGVLTALLDPLSEQDVVAVNSTPKKNRGALAPVVNTLTAAEDRLVPHINGQAYSLSTTAWQSVRPFRQDVDQRDSYKVRSVVEFNFHSALRQQGHVVRARDAVVYEDGRRIEHKVGRSFDRFNRYPRSDYSRERGVKTFQDDDPNQ